MTAEEHIKAGEAALERVERGMTHHSWEESMHRLTHATAHFTAAQAITLLKAPAFDPGVEA